jgi:hypothetical protein
MGDVGSTTFLFWDLILMFLFAALQVVVAKYCDFNSKKKRFH